MSEEKPRDIASGQYVHSKQSVCKCGHSLGQHTAIAYKGKRECIVLDCGCERFKKVGKQV